MANDSASRRWRRARTIGVLLGIACVLVATAPLVFQGPVARWVFGRTFASRCGHFALGDAHLGWASTFDLVFGRPMDVTIEDLFILSPDGHSVLQLDRASAAVKVELHPLRITVVGAEVNRGQWLLATGPDGGGLAEAFRPVPSQGRAACLVPAHTEAPASSGAPATIVVEEARLDDLDVDLDFPEWRLALSRIHARLSLSLDRSFHFDFREVTATSGSLRVGASGSEWGAAIPFDHVAIDRVGVADAATDLVLEVASARTGRAELGGRATFHNVFEEGGAPAGLDVAAHWRSFGGALAMLAAPWRPPAEWARHLDGDIEVTMDGPFTDLRAKLDARGRGAGLRAELQHGLARLQLAIEGADTHWMVGPALGPIFGGRLHGSLKARLQLASALSGMDGEVEEAALRLDRGVASGPEQVALRLGGAHASTEHGLSVTIERVHLTAGQLHIVDAELAWSRLSARADATLALAEGRLELAFPRRSRFTVGKLRLQLPTVVLMRWDDLDGLALSPVRLSAGGGVFIEVAARITPDERLDGHVRVHAYPLDSLPRLDAAEVKGMLSGSLFVSGRAAAPSARGRVYVPSLAVRGRPLGAVRASLRFDRSVGHLTARMGDSLVATATLASSPRLTVSADISLRRRALGPWLPAPLVAAPIDASGTIHLSYSLAHPLVTNTIVDFAGPGLDNVRLVAESHGQLAVARLAGQIDLAPWARVWSPYLAAAEGALSVDLEVRDPFTAPMAAGSAFIARDVKLRLRRRLGTLRLFAGDSVSLVGNTLSTRALRVDALGFLGRISGHAEMGTTGVWHLPLSLSLVGDVDLAHLPLGIVANNTARGRAMLDVRLEGTLAAPSIGGDVSLQNVVLQLASLPRILLGGTLSADGQRVTTRGLLVDVARVGRIAIGTAERVASVTWQSLHPMQLGEVDVPFSGQNLVLASPWARLQIRDLDVHGRLTGGPGAFTLVGDATIAGGVLDVRRAEKSTTGGGRTPWYASLPPGLTLDLRLRGPKKAMRVDVPFLPDVTVDFDCHLRATRQWATLTGDLHGEGGYDRTAVKLYGWLAGKDLRRCGIED